MAEEKAQYYSNTEEEMDSVHEDLNVHVRDEGVWKSYWMMPNIVNDMDISKEAFRLYSNLKRVCGETGASWQSTETLAIYCGMGTGTVSRAKEELQNYIIPLIKVEKKRKKGGGIYHDITILDIWNINTRYSKGTLGIKFDKVLKYESLKEKKKLEKLGRVREENERSSTVELRRGERSSTVETKNTTINNTTYLPAIAGDKLCEECKEDKMCEKCEMLKQKIELGTEYGFEFDVKNSKEMLKKLTEVHKTEDPTEHKKVTQNERIVAMMQGSKDEYADKLADYPDRCRKPLNYFLHKWSISPNAVPKKSKSKGGAFATWIMGIDELVQISGEKRFELVLDKVYDVWYNKSSDYRWAIDRPQSVKKQFVSCDAELRQEEIATMKEEVKKAKEKTEEKKDFISGEDGAKLMKQLQKSLKKGKQ